MNLAQQRKIIAVSAIITFAMGSLSHAQRGELPTARFLIGTGGIFTVISVFADFGSPIGAGMAIVVLLASVLTQGRGVINLLTQRAGENPAQFNTPELEEQLPVITPSLKHNFFHGRPTVRRPQGGQQ